MVKKVNSHDILRRQVFNCYCLEQAEVNIMINELDKSIKKCFKILYIENNIYFRNTLLKNISYNFYKKRSNKHLSADDDKKLNEVIYKITIFILDYKKSFNSIYDQIEITFLYRYVLLDILEIFYKEGKKYLKNEKNYLEFSKKEKKSIDDLDNIKNIEKENLKILSNLYMVKTSSFGIFKRFNKYYDLILNIKEQIKLPFTRISYSISSRISKGFNDTFFDNFQNGTTGIDRAIGRYDVRRKAMFSSVVESWVKQSIFYDVKKQDSLMRIPQTTWVDYKKIQDVQFTTGITDNEKIANILNLPVKRIKHVKEIMLTNVPINIDDLQTKNENENEYKNDFIDDNEENKKNTVKASIENYLEKLGTEENKIICFLFGLFDYLEGEDIPKEELEKESLRQYLCSQKNT